LSNKLKKYIKVPLTKANAKKKIGFFRENEKWVETI